MPFVGYTLYILYIVYMCVCVCVCVCVSCNLSEIEMTALFLLNIACQILFSNHCTNRLRAHFVQHCPQLLASLTPNSTQLPLSLRREKIVHNDNPHRHHLLVYLHPFRMYILHLSRKAVVGNYTPYRHNVSKVCQIRTDMSHSRDIFS